MNEIQKKLTNLSANSHTWLVTGVAGFIGSHLLEFLLKHGQTVVGLDNFTTGRRANFAAVERSVGEAWRKFRFLEGDIRDKKIVAEALTGVDFVLHQAALGSVPRSVKDPIATNSVNVEGFINVLLEAHSHGVKRFVYASSSSVYGDNQDKVKKEDRLGNPLSPYAASKKANELYAASFQSVYRIETVGLRYFNVFGPRQDPAGDYAAVIPKWLDTLFQGRECVIFGDGQTSRDFCYVENVVQANILAALAPKESTRAFYNVALGNTTSLNELYRALQREVVKLGFQAPENPRYEDFRAGDVKYSLADISMAAEHLGFSPSVSVSEGFSRTVKAYAPGSG